LFGEDNNTPDGAHIHDFVHANDLERPRRAAHVMAAIVLRALQ
jgi:UDP-glucose 4-epimerase